MRYTIHLKPLNLLDKVGHIPGDVVGMLEHLKLLKFLRQRNYKASLELEKRMIHFETATPGIIAHIRRLFSDQIVAILSDKHGAGLYKRPSQHTTKGLLNGLFPPSGPQAQALTPLQVAKAYNFPVGQNLENHTVAIVELGGGFNASTIRTYCKQLGVVAPKLYIHCIDGGTNTQDGPNGADGEVSLDICVVAAVAPGVKILVVFAPNTSNGFIDAIATLPTYILKPDAITISWGSDEANWDPAAMEAMDNAIQDCVNHGIPVLVAAGDNGSSDGGNGNNVDYPGSSPHAISCGGTELILNTNGTRYSEVVWNEDANGSGATGGGVSAVYAADPLQTKLLPSLKKRAVPDISGNADPYSGYQVNVDGSAMAIGGTSAVAPLMASLVALLQSNLTTPIGDFRAALYANSGIFFDVVSGNNGAYSATKGFDCASGLGVPDGTKLLNALKSVSPKRGLLHKILHFLFTPLGDQ